MNDNFISLLSSKDDKALLRNWVIQEIKIIRDKQMLIDSILK